MSLFCKSRTLYLNKCCMHNTRKNWLGWPSPKLLLFKTSYDSNLLLKSCNCFILGKKLRFLKHVEPTQLHQKNTLPYSRVWTKHVNMNRNAIGLLETPLLLKEFRDPSICPFHIAYDENLSHALICGKLSKIFTYKNVFSAQDIDLKYETLKVDNEPLWIALDLIITLFTLIIRMVLLWLGETSSIQKKNQMSVDIQRNAWVLFNKENYYFRGMHYTLSGKYLICAIQYQVVHKNASAIRISNDEIVENEFQNNARGDQKFLKTQVCL